MNEVFGFSHSHTYHNYNVEDLKEKCLIEMRCSTHGVVGRRARMPAAYNLHRYQCRDCGKTITFVDNRPPAKIRKKAASGTFRIKIKV